MKEAMQLAELGFSVICLKNRSKAPVGANWTQTATRTPEELKESYVVGRNIGVRLGEPSRVQGFYLHVIDMDIRDDDFTDEARDKLAELLELDDVKNLDRFPTVISGSGGESRHFYFLAERAYRSKTLWHSDDKMEGDDGKEHWCAEIELFGTGKQVALPPSIHPDTGKAYVWEEGFDITEALIPDLEPDLLDRITGQDEEYDVEYDAEILGITYEEAEDYLAKLDVPDWCDDREGWRNVGMALHHEFEGHEDAFDAWVKFSKQSKKFNLRVAKEQWASFKGRTDRPITFASIIKAANDYAYIEEYDGIVAEFDEDDDDDDDEVRPPKKRDRKVEDRDLEDDIDDAEYSAESGVKVKGVPDHLLTIPGVLGKAVDFYNETSVRWQPQFAVQTAIALAGVVLGRYWTSDERNYPNLYLVNLGETGAGKEYSREFISRILDDCDIGGLVGPSAYASESAVLGSLRYRPRHIAILDEFGRLLGSTRDSGNTNLRDAQTALMSAFGIGSAKLAPKAFSHNGKSDKQIASEMTAITMRPSITILGMSTPTTFYDSLSNEALMSGFLNRFLVVASRTVRQKWRSRRDASFAIPKALSKWIDEHALPDEVYANRKDDFGGNGDDPLAGIGVGESFDDPEKPKVIDFSDESQERIEELFYWTEDRKAELKATRRSDMYGRAHEITMRLSLIVALSRRAKKIELRDLNWAWDYVHFYTEQMVEMADKMLGSNDKVRLAEGIATFLKSRKGAWLSLGDINRKFPELRAIDPRNRDEIIARLTDDYDIEAGKSRQNGGGGRPTMKLRAKV